MAFTVTRARTVAGHLSAADGGGGNRYVALHRRGHGGGGGGGGDGKSKDIYLPKIPMYLGLYNLLC